MDLKQIWQKVLGILGKYRYAALILLIGFALMMIPGGKEPQAPSPVQDEHRSDVSQEEKLATFLASVKGAGRVEVLLSYAEGERTMYQTDEDGQRSDTVTVTDGSRNQTGLITQVVPPVYKGAVILCQGGADPSVRLAIVDAVSKYTGLGANQIAVLEMK